MSAGSARKYHSEQLVKYCSFRNAPDKGPLHLRSIARTDTLRHLDLLEAILIDRSECGDRDSVATPF